MHLFLFGETPHVTFCTANNSTCYIKEAGTLGIPRHQEMIKWCQLIRIGIDDLFQLRHMIRRNVCFFADARYIRHQKPQFFLQRIDRFLDIIMGRKSTRLAQHRIHFINGAIGFYTLTAFRYAFSCVERGLALVTRSCIYLCHLNPPYY